jgi:secondary thiamine-phosphate synthase enzyme
MAMKTIRVHSSQREQVLDITSQIQEFVSKHPHKSGLVAVYCPHTTAAVSVNENADPDVKHDLIEQLKKTIPRSPEFHHSEGNTDVPISLFGMFSMESVQSHSSDLTSSNNENGTPTSRRCWRVFRRFSS